MEKPEKKPKEKPHEKKETKEKKVEEIIVRILATDIPGGASVYHGLTKIKGVSWTFSNAICSIL